MSWLPPCAVIWAGSRPKGRDQLGVVLSADAGAAGVLRHRVAAAAGEAAGSENGNRRSETTAYEPLGSRLRHRVRVAGADAAGTGTGDCDGGGGR